MCYKEFNLNSIDTKELSTKLAFDIATARSSSFQLVKFTFDAKVGERFTKAVNARLKEMKKQGRIVLFVSSKEFSNQTTELQYLLNKFPSISEERFSDETISFFVKI